MLVGGNDVKEGDVAQRLCATALSRFVVVVAIEGEGRIGTYSDLTAEVEGPALLVPEIDMRFSAFFMIVFILVNTLLPILFLFSSFGTDGPPCAGELMFAVLIRPLRCCVAML